MAYFNDLDADKELEKLSETLSSLKLPLTESDSTGDDSQGPSRRPSLLKPPRLSESNIPLAPKPRRLSSSSNGGKTPSHAPAASPRSSTANTTPRETRSSVLRKSVSTGDGSSLRAALSAMKDGKTTPNAAGSELSRMRIDLRAKQKEVEELESSLATLKISLGSKERALVKVQTTNDELKGRASKAEGELMSRTKTSRKLESDKLQLQNQADELKKEVDKLKRKLDSIPKGTGLSEAIATLEGETKHLKAENVRLDGQYKGACNQIRAKDKELDTMALEVEAAREILVQNGELENYVLELRKQLDETNNDRGTLLNVQRQMRTDMAKMSDDMKDAKDDAAKAKHDLNISQTNLKASKENAQELSQELELRKKELIRVGKVASRAAHKEATQIKEDGMIEFHLHKDEIMQMKADHERTKQKLVAAEKSAIASEKKLQLAYKKLDAYEEVPRQGTATRGQNKPLNSSK